MKNTPLTTLLLISLAPIALLAHAQAQGAGPLPRPTDDAYSFTLYAVVVLVSAFCGSINFAKWYVRPANDERKHFLVRWFIDASTAAVSGVVTFLVCQSQGVGLPLTCVAFIAAAMGWASAIDIARTAIGRGGLGPTTERKDP